MKLTVVIPNYNGKKFMEVCMEAIDKQTYKDYRLLIIDNASTDGSIEYMKDNYPEVEVIQMDKNYGFSGAVNKGIMMTETPYVILLNNDTRIDEHFFENMVKGIEKDDKIFSGSSKMIKMYHPEQIDDAGDMYCILGWGYQRGAGKDSTKYTKTKSVFSACAGAAIYRTQILKDIGMFDELHFAYLEDMDVGYRARINGYKNIYIPDAICYHVGSGTSGSKYNDFKVKLASRNNIYLNYKNMPIAQLIINIVPLLLGILIKMFFFSIKGFGKAYRSGLKEGITSLGKAKKVKFRFRNIINYFIIELQLIINMFIYIKDMLSKIIRKFTKKSKSID